MGEPLRTRLCGRCRRASAGSASRCIWCGEIFTTTSVPVSASTRQSEVEYVEGIDRFSDPAAVILVINEDGVELREVMPGTRTISIPASSIIGAQAVGPRSVPEGGGSTRWLSRLARIGRKPLRLSHRIGEGFLLILSYRDGSETHEAVLRIEAAAGFQTATDLARSINALAETTTSSD